MFSTRALLLAALISTGKSKLIICVDKASNKIQTCDRHGCGQYSAQRSQRPHQGVDEKPYQNKNAINNAVQISGRDKRGFCVKMFYIKPIENKGPMKRGEKLGTLLPLQKVSPGIRSHVRIQNCDLSDPAAYL
uniref:Uncharacterized protein n=1 Tax=Saimiri boliviensis boliviensis TaxID=39432 RepID=A0A2K6ULR7_SAIBB